MPSPLGVQRLSPSRARRRGKIKQLHYHSLDSTGAPATNRSGIIQGSGDGHLIVAEPAEAVGKVGGPHAAVLALRLRCGDHFTLPPIVLLLPLWTSSRPGLSPSRALCWDTPLVSPSGCLRRLCPGSFRGDEVPTWETLLLRQRWRRLLLGGQHVNGLRALELLLPLHRFQLKLLRLHATQVRGMLSAWVLPQNTLNCPHLQGPDIPSRLRDGAPCLASRAKPWLNLLERRMNRVEPA